MKKYVDYDYYVNEFDGNLEESTFNKHAIKATALLRNVTNGKADNSNLEEVKYACCVLIDEINSVESAKVDGKNVSSVSNDGYSVSFVTDNSKSVEQIEITKANDVAHTYLATTGLLSRCVFDRCELEGE